MNKPQPQTGPEIEEYSTTATPKAYAGSVPVFCAHDAIVPLKDLRPNPKNPNQHPPEQIKLLASIIRATGWRAPITVSKRSGLVTKGHGRLMAAQLDDLTGTELEAAETALFRQAIMESKTIIWNGPAGVFEDDRFAAGTKVMADAIASLLAMGATRS